MSEQTEQTACGGELQTMVQTIVAEAPEKMVLGKPRSKQGDYRKCEVRPFSGGYQITKYTEKQAFHQNVTKEACVEALTQLLCEEFLQLYGFCAEAEYALLLSKKGKPTLQRKKKSLAKNNASAAGGGHNRRKNYLLQEGDPIPALTDMGIFTKEGRIVSSMQDKFRQINRFLELLDDTISEQKPKKLNVIDFGCGKSYLTFLVYHYLTKLRGIEANIIGLDLKKDVIEKCNRAAKAYGYTGLRFELGDINGYTAPFEVDMVITLHACDVATDFALYNAIQWNAKMIFSVPCCQHEVNGQLQPESLGLLSRYGIVKERFSALLTDSIRANLLITQGYSTQLLEFVDFSHTPKNIMIRAKRAAMLPKRFKEQAAAEIESARAEFHITPMLYRLLLDGQEE